MTNKTARRLFTAVLIFLPLQYAVVGVTSVIGWPEPWPAVVLPGFKGVWDSETQFDVPQAEFHAHFEDGSAQRVPVEDVFGSVPASNHLGILRRQFMPSSMSGTMRTEQGRSPGTRSWLSGRLAHLYGGRLVDRLDVVWYRTHYRAHGEYVGKTAVDTLEIALR